jgi:hypothetical protein
MLAYIFLCVCIKENQYNERRNSVRGGGSGSAVIRMKHRLQFCCYPMQSRRLAFRVDKKKVTWETEQIYTVISICGSAAQFVGMEL